MDDLPSVGKRLPGSPGEPLSTKTIESLFAKLASIYGHKFVDQWAGIDQRELKSTWAEALGVLSISEIRAGLSALVQSGSPFPPTLPEFFAYCRPRVAVPPVTDQAGLDALARQLGVSNSNCGSYHEFRSRILSAIDDRSNVPRLGVKA